MTKTIKPGTRGVRSILLDRDGLDQDKRTIELSFSSELPVERSWGVEILDHSGESVRLGRMLAGAPLLSDHSNSIRSQIGIVESVRIDSDRKGRAVVRFGKSAADDEIFQKVQDGIIRNVSVGYIIHRAEVEGDEDGFETYRVVDWEPFEISLVAVPADESVGVGRALESPIIETMENQEMADNKDVSAADQERAITEKVTRGIEAERKRVSDIMALGVDHADIGGNDMASRAIKDNVSVQDFQNEILKAVSKSRKHDDVDVSTPTVTVTERIEEDGTYGFKSIGDLCRFARSHQLGVKLSEHNHIRSASSFASITSGEDGAILIPPAFQTTIDRYAFDDGSLLDMVAPTTIEGNTMSYPKSESTPWGSTGVQSYWEGEASTLTPSKPSYEPARLTLKKLTSMVNVTDEMLEDASAMSSEIPREMGAAVNWKVTDALINGTGAGMPLGMLVSSATVSQGKEIGQTADTIVAGNVAKMMGRLINGGGNIVWLVNPDAYNQIITMTLGDQPVWTAPSSGFKQAPNGLLLGRPIIMTDACKKLGDSGDIILANLSGYRAITKAGGPKLDRSMHLYFDQGIEAFRLVFRLDAQPRFSAPVTPPNSGSTRSHFVKLAARA